MKIKYEYHEDEYEDEESAWYSLDMIADDGRVVARFRDMCQCPEDNTYGRDHSDVPRLHDLLAAAYQAGARGEGLEIVKTDIL